jgi:hypothetical protein
MIFSKSTSSGRDVAAGFYARSGRGGTFGYVRIEFGRNRQSTGREGECPHGEGGLRDAKPPMRRANKRRAAH